MFRKYQNTSNLLDFVATWHCQGNPGLSSISRLELTCTAALRILLGLRLKTETLYSYLAFKVRKLASSAEAFQLATNLNLFELMTLLYNGSKLYTVKFSSHNIIYFVNIIGDSAFPLPLNQLLKSSILVGSPHAENA